jgi:hypothetical protein
MQLSTVQLPLPTTVQRNSTSGYILRPWDLNPSAATFGLHPSSLLVEIHTIILLTNRTKAGLIYAPHAPHSHQTPRDRTRAPTWVPLRCH